MLNNKFDLNLDFRDSSVKYIYGLIFILATVLEYLTAYQLP